MVPPSAEKPFVDEDDQYEVRGYKNHLAFCDDSGLHGSTHYGFGSFWIPYERRGDLQTLVRKLRGNRAPDEIKWNKISSSNKQLYLDIVDTFFSTPWMRFHALIVRKGYIDKTLHKNGYDDARCKHFGMLLRAKIAHFSKYSAGTIYHARVDKLPSSYEKADERAYKIINAQLVNEIGNAALKTLFTRDSKQTLGIQLADVFLGAVMDDVCGDSSSEHKAEVRQRVAHHMEWPDLKLGTHRAVVKFNLWHFWNPRDGTEREVPARPVPSRILTGG